MGKSRWEGEESGDWKGRGGKGEEDELAYLNVKL